MTGRIVDNGPHVVDVYPRVIKATDIGDVKVDAVEPVTVERVRVSARTADVAALADGARYPTTLYRIVGAGQWPGGDGCIVVIEVGPESGRVLRQVGDTVYRASSSRTEHFVVTCRTQGDAA